MCHDKGWFFQVSTFFFQHTWMIHEEIKLVMQINPHRTEYGLHRAVGSGVVAHTLYVGSEPFGRTCVRIQWSLTLTCTNWWRTLNAPPSLTWEPYKFTHSISSVSGGSAPDSRYRLGLYPSAYVPSVRPAPHVLGSSGQANNPMFMPKG